MNESKTTKIIIPAHWDRNDPVLEIAISNYESAIDLAHTYDSLEQSIESYAQNAVDTAREQGLPKELWDQAGDAVLTLYKELLAKAQS